MSEQSGEPQLTEEQLRQLEAELDRITVDDIVLQTVVSLINIGARRAALGAPAGEGPAPDWEQARQAIEAVRALLPVLESRHADKLAPVRDALSQLQLHYARGAAASGAAAGSDDTADTEGRGERNETSDSQTERSEPPGTGPAQRSGKLWVPGQ